MSTIITIPMTADLEPALRYLAANPSKQIEFIADKFKKQKKAIWSWLEKYNRSKKTLPAHVIDSALAAEKNQPAKMSTATLVPRRLSEKLGFTPSPALQLVRPPALTQDVEKWLNQQNVDVAGARFLSFQVKVTPDLAASWLLLNQGNRNPSKAKVRRFAASIKAGRWVLNGETIKFSISGRLLDGQSRLKAIVMAGTPAMLEIRGGLPDEAQKAMDIGEARKGTHTLEMMGEKYPNILSPALRWIFRWENGALSYKGQSGGVDVTVLENMEIEPMLKRHDGLRASVGWCVSAGYKVTGMMPPSEAAFFHYLLGRASVAKRDVFFAGLATGLGLTDKSPAYHLRERLQTDRASSKRMSVRERTALVIKAWNAHFSGEKVGQLGFRATGDFKEAYPSIAGLKAPEKAA
jgi:hypothetical protein